MNPVVEKVAEAIWSGDPRSTDFDEGWIWLGEEYRSEYRSMAEAAIEALGLTKEVQSIPVFKDTGELVTNRFIQGPDLVPEKRLHFIPSWRWVSKWVSE